MFRIGKNLIDFILILFFLSLPVFIKDEYYLHILIMICFNVLLALGVNFIYRTGQLTLATAAFMGIGAYSSVLLMMKLNLPFVVTFPLSGIIALIFALIIGRITLRLKEVYFVLVTFAFNEIARLVFTAWVDFFGGANGIGDIPPANVNLFLHEFVFDTKASFYVLACIVTIFTILVFTFLLKSPIGKVFKVIRSSDVLAQSIGVNLMGYKLFAFAVGCFFTGLNGSLFAHYFQFISPYSFTFWVSVHAIMMNVIGGIRSTRGCILGAVIFTLLVEAVRVGKEFELMIYGGMIVFTVLFLPEGVNNIVEIIERKIHKYIEGLPKRMRTPGNNRP
jgi:branched-chain amino acid transport system permease protein